MSGRVLTKKLRTFFEGFPEARYEKGGVIERPGDESTVVYFIKQGYVRWYAVSEEGEELTLTVFKPGSFFMAVMPLETKEQAYYVEAMTETVVHKAARTRVMSFLKDEPEVLYDLLMRMGSGVMGLLTRMESLVFGSAYAKVAGVMLIAAKRFGRRGEDGKTRIELPLTHQEIASMSGLTRETATHQISRLKRAGLISVEKKCYVVEDEQKLAVEVRLSQYD